MIMMPFILATPSMDEGKLHLRHEYCRALQSVGLGIMIASGEARSHPRQYLERVSGLLLSGGADLDPVFFGQEPHPRLGEVNPIRDELELELTRTALEMGMPILAVCRGIQVLNVAMGGTLIQDIPSQRPLALKHSQKAPRSHTSHGIQVQALSRLASIYPQGTGRVNSFHHQAIDKLGDGLMVSALASDGIIEAVETVGESFIIGVQWHPEDLYNQDASNSELFAAFAKACQVYG